VSTLTGTAALARLIVRRDRWLLLLWVGLITAYALSMVPITEDLNPTAVEREAYVGVLNSNSAFAMLYGPVYGSSLGALATWRAGDVLWIVGLVSLLTVIRHTRADEEAGRRELLGSAVVGRHAGLAAALIVVFVANLVLAAVIALGLVGQGLPGTGSLAYGLKVAGVGWTFGAVAAVAAQLTEGAGAARSIAAATLGGAFLVRAAGDAGGVDGGASWLSWLSPIGWAHHVHPFSDDRWWVLGLAVGVVAVLTPTAFVLSARRDVGAGVLPPRPGPAGASPQLRNPLSFAWRLHRGQLLTWLVALTAMGTVFGGSAAGAADLFGASPEVADLFERLGGEAGASDLFLAGIMGLLGLFAAAYAVQATLRLRSEEDGLRAEPVLATAVSRVGWATSHLALSLAGPAIALAAGGLSGGLAYGLTTGEVARELPRVLAGALVQLPAVWVLVGITFGLYGLVPRLAWAGWAALAVFVFLGQLGALLQLSPWLLDLSPFTHVPKIPGSEITPIPLVVLLAITGLLVITGLVGLRRRDIGRA